MKETAVYSSKIISLRLEDTDTFNDSSLTYDLITLR